MPSARDIAFIGCRLLALYALYAVLLTFAHTVLTLAQTLTVATSGFGQFVLSYGTSLAVNLVVFLALWFGADRIAQRVAPEGAPPREETATVWTRQHVLTLALVVLGVWVLIHYLPTLLGHLYLLFADDSGGVVRDRAGLLSSILTATLASGFGLLCLFGPRGIAGVIVKLRRW
ncbi:MAG: hypothetical protein RH942_07935 [Kiloniellaceae bacterium]